MTTLASIPSAGIATASASPNRWARLRAWLPHGGSLPADVWRARHRALLRVLVLHVPAVMIFGLARGFPLWHAALSTAPVAALWLAALTAERRAAQEFLCASGLITASSMLVHLAGGNTEMHFHFFVMVALLSLYQDWLPFLTALVLVVLEHGVVGSIWPHQVYDHASAWRDPWLWALIHGVFVLGASVASLAAWSINERDHHRIQDELERLRIVREQQLHHQLQHDPLTGLGNRRLLTERLRAVLADVDRKAPVALLFVDLDGFKGVNDRFGHDVGDQVLVRVSARIAGALRPEDVATRLGGDEFVVLCIGLSDAAAAVSIAQRSERAVAEPSSTELGVVSVTASVGIACSDQWPHDAERLLHEADIAMYRAKQLGKDRCQLFDADMRDLVTQRDDREETLRHALENDGLRLVYQPIFDAPGRLCSVEALLRIVDQDGNLHAPMPYVELAEETGLIGQIGRWVLEQGCAQLASWHALAPGLVLTLNVSGHEVSDEGLADRVLETLDRYNLPPTALALELTETALIDTASAPIAQLRRLFESGVHIGVDDFGTGYASLQYLRSLPIDFIKVDRSFVAGLPLARPDRGIIAAITAMSRELGLRVIAEGVETDAQLEDLRRLGVEYVQGFLLDYPMRADELAHRLASGPVLPRQRQEVEELSQWRQ
ncbi:MAG: putative bifunctional diguanylate cyclase/phosphodiesterase [Mycobacteriales bacterium]